MHTEFVAVLGTSFLCLLFFIAGVIFGKTKAIEKERLLIKEASQKELEKHKKRFTSNYQRNNIY
jgi:hypothetical protein